MLLASHEGFWHPHGFDWVWTILFFGWVAVFGGALLVSLLLGLFGKDRG